MRQVNLGVAGDNAANDNELCRFHLTGYAIQRCANVYIDDNGRLGINEASPETLIELSHASPYMTFHCTTESDAANSGMSILWFSREQSGGEETHGAAIKAAHDGSNNDQKMYLAFHTNSGTDADAPTERMRIDSSGKVGIRVPTPRSYLHVGDNNDPSSGFYPVGTLVLLTNQGYNTIFALGNANSDGNSRASFYSIKSRGTCSSPAACVNGDFLGSYLGAGYTDANPGNTQYPTGIFFRVDGAVSSGVLPSAIAFYTGTNTAGRTEKMRVTSGGNIGIGVTDPDTKLEIFSTSTQLKLSYDATNYCTLATGANGDTTVTTVDSDGAAGNINLNPDGSTTLGDGGTTDYIAFSSVGQASFAGDARYKRTEWISAENFGLPSTNPAAKEEYGVGLVLEFGDEAINYEHAWLKIGVPKDIDSSVQPILIVGWSCPTADPGDDSVQVRWELAYLWRGPDEVMDAAAEATITDNYTTSRTAKGLVVTEIQLANFSSTDRCFTAILTRRSDNAGDTANGVAANVSGACLYYVSNKLGEAI